MTTQAQRSPLEPAAQSVAAFHALRPIEPDPDFELGLTEYLKAAYPGHGLLDLYGRFATGTGDLDALMRRALWRALARQLGHGARIGTGVGFTHPETFEIGDGVLIGDQAYLQGRIEGRCAIGDHVWIGPQSYLDARALTLEEYTHRHGGDIRRPVGTRTSSDGFGRLRCEAVPAINRSIHRTMCGECLPGCGD